MSKKNGQLVWHTEKRKVKDLIPFPNNPRRLTEKQHADLKKSLTKFDLVEIPAIDLDGTIISGNQRIKILAEINGTEEIDVRLPNRKLTEEERKEYNIRANKNTGEFDFDILAEAFNTDELIDWGFDKIDLGIFDFKNKEKEIDENGLPTEHECPKCGYKW